MLLAAALVGFAAGCLALQWQAALPALAPWLGGAGVLCSAAAWVARLGVGPPLAWAAPLLMAAGMGAAGFGYAAWRAESRLADALPPEWESVDLAVIGIVDDLPSISVRGARFAFAVERVVTPGAVVPKRISLAWFPTQRAQQVREVPPIRAGERWRLTVRLKRPHGNVNPHGFDLEAWLLDNGLRATGYVYARGDNVRLDAFAGRASDWIQRARESVRDRALQALGDAPYAGVMVALAIGEQRAIPEAQWAIFNRTGITHLISISGLHVTVFAALAAALVHGIARRSTRLTSRIAAHRVAAAVGALAAFGYVLLAGAQVPAQRTLIMLAVAAMGLWLARPGTARMVWSWALALVLLFDPWAGLTPGFWLSFGAVALLLYTGTARLSSTARSLREKLGGALRTATHAQFVVTVGLVPLTLAVFQQVSLVAPVANALAIPVVTFAVVPLALSAVVLPLDVLWQIAHGVFALLMVPLDWLAKLPGVTWQQHAPAPWSVVAAMLGIVWTLAPRGVPLRTLGALWMLPMWVVRPPAPAEGTFVLTVLDVGQGLAAIVRTHAHVLLYDTGPRYNEESDAGGRIVAPYLRAAGITRLSTLVVSHLDADHSGGTRALLQTLPVDAILTSVSYADPLWASAPRDVVRCRAGQQWSWDGVTFTMLHPQPWSYAQPRIRTNDLSCVLRIDSPHGSALLTGDIEARSEAVLLREFRELLPTDVLIVPHHGSRTSSIAPFIAATSPRIAVFTAGYRNRFGHPRADVVERYRSAHAALLRTDASGAITLRFERTYTPAVLAARDAERRYWFALPRQDGDDVNEEPP